jgi:hypothetical protein
MRYFLLDADDRIEQPLFLEWRNMKNGAEFFRYAFNMADLVYDVSRYRGHIYPRMQIESRKTFE